MCADGGPYLFERADVVRTVWAHRHRQRQLLGCLPMPTLPSVREPQPDTCVVVIGLGVDEVGKLTLGLGVPADRQVGPPEGLPGVPGLWLGRHNPGQELSCGRGVPLVQKG